MSSLLVFFSDAGETERGRGPCACCLREEKVAYASGGQGATQKRTLYNGIS